MLAVCAVKQLAVSLAEGLESFLYKRLGIGIRHGDINALNDRHVKIEHIYLFGAHRFTSDIKVTSH